MGTVPASQEGQLEVLHGRGPGPGVLEEPACGSARQHVHGPLSPALSDLQDSTWDHTWGCV